MEPGDLVEVSPAEAGSAPVGSSLLALVESRSVDGLRLNPAVRDTTPDPRHDKDPAGSHFPFTGGATVVLRRWDGLDHKLGDSRSQSLLRGRMGMNQFGVEIEFHVDEGACFRPGDYWLVPTRSLSNDVEWPRREGAAEQEPRRCVHRLAPLAVLSPETGGWQCRTVATGTRMPVEWHRPAGAADPAPPYSLEEVETKEGDAP